MTEKPVLYDERLPKLIDISRQMAETRALDPLLQYSMDTTLDMFGAEYGFLVLIGETGELDFRVKRSRGGGEISEPEMQISYTILGQAITTEKALITASAIEDPFYSNAHSVHALKLRSVMCAPLIARGTVIGGLYVENRTLTDLFRDADLEIFGYIASHAAVCIENARFNEMLEQKIAERTEEVKALAVNSERQRLARELHDSVTQTLFSASMVAQTLPHLWKKGSDAVQEGLVELARLNLGALAEMRTMLFELRPHTLETANMRELLTHLMNALAGRMMVEYTLNVEGERDLPSKVQLVFYRVAQEALNNIFKHSGATFVEAHLIRTLEGVRLSIRDNGKGFDLKMIQSGHMGLMIMHERATGVGAQFQCISAPDKGCLVELVWNVQEDA
ncbi:MAG TPA: GAF domain-containing sensor histidine kinase [Aggregatilineales bacterium]|nr:GAF domain-containing sensor histidine kinase [Anaerolineales bacterium]HRE47592.1 GAF domain-containing sensor histidine kinase [Aggregatilineales bacterium]